MVYQQIYLQAAQARFPGQHLAVWQLSPWQRLDKYQLPGEGAKKFQETMLQDEIHDIALGLTNLTASPCLVKVKFNGIPPEAVELRYSYWTRGVRGKEEQRPDIEKFREVDDVALKFDRSQEMLIKSGENQRIRAQIDGSKLTPGKYHFEFELISENHTQKIPGVLHVAPVKLQFPSDFHISSYAYLDRPSTANLTQIALKQVSANFENTFVINGNWGPFFDAKTGQWDCTKLVNYLKFLKTARPKMLLFFWNAPFTAVAAPKTNWNTPQWKNHLKAALQQWTTACQQAGFSKKQFAMYPIDEVYDFPCRGRQIAYHALLDIVKVIKEADPEIQIFCNPILFRQKDIAYFKKLAPYIDIWAPVQSLYHDCDHTGHPRPYTLAEKKLNREFFKREQLKGKALWTYQCDGPVKNLDLNGYYRIFSWRSWLHGLTGLGIWSYNDIRGTSWNDEDRGDFSFIYEKRDAPRDVAERTDELLIPAQRYLAWRRSLQDYALLAMAAQKVGRPTVEKLVRKALKKPFDHSGFEQVRNKIITIITK